MELITLEMALDRARAAGASYADVVAAAGR